MSNWNLEGKTALVTGGTKGIGKRGFPNLTVLDTDVAKATRTADFAAVYPDQFFNCGVQEQNCLSVAAGLSIEGFVPFATSFGMFFKNGV